MKLVSNLISANSPQVAWTRGADIPMELDVRYAFSKLITLGNGGSVLSLELLKSNATARKGEKLRDCVTVCWTISLRAHFVLVDRAHVRI